MRKLKKDTHASSPWGDEARAREAGRVALKGFFKIAELWQLSPSEMTTMLGGIHRSTLYKYQGLAREGGVELGRDLMERISYTLGIYKALRILFPSEERAVQWVRRPNSASPFNGGTALEWMLRGSIVDLADVRRYLDAQRG